ncbi:MAG: hypothetical protein PHW92_06640 [Lutibacter sp.]|nr:hypothetical protein [Lutibacter sp.]
MATKHLFFICFFVLAFQMQSQTTYMTKNGHLKMVGRIDNQPVAVETNELSVFLDYTTKQMNGEMDLRTLVTEIPELNSYLRKAEQPLLVQFSGVIPADDFMSQPHQALIFNWLVKVTFQNKSFEVVFKTTLEHIEEGSFFSCRLSTFGEIQAAKLGLEDLIPGLGETIELQFIQVVLRV